MKQRHATWFLGILLLLVTGGTVAAAQTGFGGHNGKDPIQFAADRLDVRKEGRVATFSGNVEANQGDLNLIANEVRVYYTGGSEDEAGLGGAVSRIDTRGNVKLSSRGDTANAVWAVYDIERQLVTLGGNVVLTQGETQLRGDRVELDLDTGQSRVVGVEGVGGDSRVRGEFTPKRKTDEPAQ
ncbi:MAG: LptA/OstA family protein [Alphaproteobacteria bacterium]